MALKGDRRELDTDVSFFCNQVLEPGVLVCVDGGGSGIAMDLSTALVATPTGFATPSVASGTHPVGVLLTNVVDIDQTRQEVNWHRDEVVIGGKVTLLKRGFVVTDRIVGSVSAGQPAYFDITGSFTATQANDGIVQVGRFASNVDPDNFARIEININ